MSAAKGSIPRVSDGSAAAPAERQGPGAGAGRPGGNDAVCFTSGLKGAAFSAGVIHAWLASDRKPPLVVAGISTGAISTAAFQQCYRELEGADGDELERKRWAWFRRYLEAVINEPLNVIWKAIPDPVDYFADSPPVKDLTAQKLPFGLPDEEIRSRRHYYLLIKFGTWLARLPVRLGTLASIVVYRVRKKEKYGSWLLNRALLVWNYIKAITGLWWHILRAPKFVREKDFGKGWYRPLFGWPVWMGSMVPILAVVFLVIRGIRHPWWAGAIDLIVALVVAVAGLLVYLKQTAAPGQKWSLKTVGWEMLRHFFQALDVEKGLLSQYELRRRLVDLFGTQTLDSALSEKKPWLRMHALIVCAALQQSKQIWPKESASVMEALSAACALPGIFPPVRMGREQLEQYSSKNMAEKADVVDGAAVRANPIPAFFDWCIASQSNQEIAAKLERKDREEGSSLHVVYNVPMDPGSLADALPPKNTDIVESAQASLELQKKRDTRQEWRQTNFVSGLESICRKATGSTRCVAFRIFADEIAPQKEIEFRNEWEPSRDESLEVAANGCRAAMETLYRKESGIAPSEAGSLFCTALLRRIAPRRDKSMHGDKPGLPEICAKCSGELTFRPVQPEGSPPRGAIRSYGCMGKDNLEKLPKEFEHLRGVDEKGGRPRIVFLGSGGVFRGAFHIGVIGAMQAVRMFPDLVVGASVGALMGGALAAISVAPEDRETAMLEELAKVFLAVDQRVALTRTLKNATKQLGVRGRDLRIAPSELRRMVLGGSRKDPGYAATGAPPALIDAISRLLVIPYRRTSQIASEFVAGHITKATNYFLREVRRETLSSFDIVSFLIGVSLLEPVARTLLGGNVSHVHLDCVQPYHDPANRKPKVSFFCTTSFLNARVALLLGRDFLTENPTWDGIYAALSSSAFPAVFAPRSEADVLPGRGRTNRLFADGGMFDNLPFFPAIEILMAGQLGGEQEAAAVLQRVQRRIHSRDIFIAAGLNAPPRPESTYDTLFKIHSRAKELSVESKVKTFIESAKKVEDGLKQVACGNPASLSPGDARFLDGTVNAAILNITPTDKDHINKTFAFCKSVGMKVETVQKSIADGCFRSLAEFVRASADDHTARKALARTRVPDLAVSPGEEVDSDEKELCPYFYLGKGPMSCPFAATEDETVRGIQRVCVKDTAHKGQWRDLKPKAGVQKS